MKRAHLYIVLAVAALIAAAAWALRPVPVTVEVVRIERGLFEQSVSDDGRTRVRDRYVVSAPLAGRVERIALKAGDRVAAGEAVARLLPAAPAFLDARTESELRERLGAAEAQQRRAQAEVLRLEAQRDQARADEERQARLAAAGFVSPTAREQAALALRVAQRALESGRFAQDAAAHDLAQARATLSRYRAGGAEASWVVTSPVSGVVLKVDQESEGVVAMGTPLVEIGDPRLLEAVVEILTQEAIALRPGMPARVEAGASAPPLAARVRRVEPAAFTKVSALGVEEQRVNVLLDIDDPAAAKALGDGFAVEVSILTWSAESVLRVPTSALFRRGDGWAVFVVDGGRAKIRAVQIGHRGPIDCEATSGLAEHDAVVAHPPASLADGAKVRGVAE